MIADEFAEEIYIGIAAIQVERANAKQTNAEQADVEPAPPRRPICADTLATMMVSVLVPLAFSLGAIIVGIALARTWR